MRGVVRDPDVFLSSIQKRFPIIVQVVYSLVMRVPFGKFFGQRELLMKVINRRDKSLVSPIAAPVFAISQFFIPDVLSLLFLALQNLFLCIQNKDVQSRPWKHFWVGYGKIEDT